MKKTTDLSGTSKGYKVFSVAILVVMVIFFLFPLYWIVTGSFKNKLEITARTPIWFPIEPTVENYARLFDNPAFLWLFNIIFISAAAMILTCLTASLAGYALGKKRFIGRGVLFTIIICAMALPKQVIVIPLAQEMTNFFHLNDTLWAVILPTVGWPFGVFLMKQFSETIPTEILEAARVDGAGELRTFITEGNSRNDLAFTMGVADKPYATTPTVTLKSAIAANQGGDHPMQGDYSDDNSIELAFDFTEAVPKYASYTEPKYFLTVTRSEIGKAGSGVINAFSVIDYRDADGPKEYVCDLPQPVVLEKGANLFAAATTALKSFLFWAVLWLFNLWWPYTTPYAIRTASGKYAKFEVMNYDRGTGRVTIKYLYQGDGTRNLNSLTD